MKNINPYPSYKPSGIAWLGDIPQHWEVRKLKYSLEINNGADYKHIQTDSGYPVIGSGGQFAFAKEFMYDGEVVFLGRKGTIDKPLYFKGKFWAVDTMFYAYAKNDNNVRFHYYVSTQIPFKLYSTSTALPSMTQTDLKSHYLAYPPIEEQTAIAHFLDYKLHKIDRFIRKKKQLIALLNEQKAAIINDAVTKGLDPSVKRKPSGIEWLGNVPKHWKVSRMKNICTVRQGLQIPISERFFEQNNDCYEYITIKSINNPENQREYIYKPSARVICDKDDILVVRTGGTGEIITNVSGVFHNNFFLVDYDRDKIDKMLLVYFLKSPKIRAYLLLVAGTTTIPDLNHGEFYNTPFFEYEKSEQKAIVTHIEKETAILNRTIATIEKEITLVQEYRTTLIAEAVTGKIDVRNYLIDNGELIMDNEEEEVEIGLDTEGVEEE